MEIQVAIESGPQIVRTSAIGQSMPHHPAFRAGCEGKHATMATTSFPIRRMPLLRPGAVATPTMRALLTIWTAARQGSGRGRNRATEDRSHLRALQSRGSANQCQVAASRRLWVEKRFVPSLVNL